MSAEFMMLSHDIAGNIQNHKSMLRKQVVRGLIDRNKKPKIEYPPVKIFNFSENTLRFAKFSLKI